MNPEPIAWPTRRLEDSARNVGPVEGKNRIVVIDDHKLLSESIVLTLRQSGFDARNLPPETPDLVGNVRVLHPDLVLLDLYLFDGPDLSLRALAGFVAADIPVIIMTGSHDSRLHASCLKDGALGIFEKSAPIVSLIDTVHRALRGERIAKEATIRQLNQSLVKARAPFESLTFKEQEVFKAIMAGFAASRIARDQGVSILTVRTHIRNILVKLDVHSQLEAVSLARRERWFDDP